MISKAADTKPVQGDEQVERQRFRLGLMPSSQPAALRAQDIPALCD
jgi:hypothetical protein